MEPSAMVIDAASADASFSALTGASEAARSGGGDAAFERVLQARIGDDSAPEAETRAAGDDGREPLSAPGSVGAAALRDADATRKNDMEEPTSPEVVASTAPANARLRRVGEPEGGGIPAVRSVSAAPQDASGTLRAIRPAPPNPRATSLATRAPQAQPSGDGSPMPEEASDTPAEDQSAPANDGRDRSRMDPAVLESAKALRVSPAAGRPLAVEVRGAEPEPEEMTPQGARAGLEAGADRALATQRGTSLSDRVDRTTSGGGLSRASGDAVLARAEGERGGRADRGGERERGESESEPRFARYSGSAESTAEAGFGSAAARPAGEDVGRGAVQPFESVLEAHVDAPALGPPAIGSSAVSDGAGPVVPSVPSVPPQALVDQAQWLASRGGGTARLQLDPPELGQVEIRVRVRGNAVHVQVITQESVATALAHEQRQVLAQNLASKDLQMERFEVHYAASADGDENGGGHMPWGEPRGRQRADEGGFDSGPARWSDRAGPTTRVEPRARMRAAAWLGERNAEVDLRV